MFELNYYSKAMKHQISLLLEGNSIELHAPAYATKLMTPSTYKKIKLDKKPFHRCVHILQGPEAALVLCQSQKAWGTTECMTNYDVAENIATSPYQKFFWVHPTHLLVMICLPMADEKPMICYHPYV